MRGGGLHLEVWCDAGGDFALPITSSVHDLLIMLYDGIKLTVGVQKTTQEKDQYCLTALGSVSK